MTVYRFIYPVPCAQTFRQLPAFLCYKQIFREHPSRFLVFNECFLRIEIKEEYLLDHRIWGVGLLNFTRHTNCSSKGLFQLYSYQLQNYLKHTFL